MYQMYAYQKKYDAQNATLLYPQTSAVATDREIHFTSNDGVTVNVRFIDMFDVHRGIQSVIANSVFSS